MAAQILSGSIVLGLCCFLHLILMFGWVKALGTITNKGQSNSSVLTQSFVLVGTLVLIIAASTTQVWIWAFSLINIGAFQTYEDAIYFSLVTFTTVGYGDLTLETEFRIFGSMASITGLLSFGISTAFLVNMLTRLFPGPLD